MIIIHVMGGLGNQLYQYAMYEKLKMIGKEVKLDLYDYKEAVGEDREWRDLELDYFEGLVYDVCSLSERTLFLDNSRKFFDRVRRKLFGRKDRIVRETKSYMPELFDMDNVYLDVDTAHLKIAGVDMSSPEPIQKAMDKFNELLEELEKLV